MYKLASEKSSIQRGEKAAKLSFFAAALIGLAKGVVGLSSGSIALLAQAVDSLTDIFASLTVYIGLKFARRRPTERFPYGYYRAETLASLIVSVGIVISGVGVLRQSVIRFLQPEVVSHPHITLSVAAISIPFLYLLAKYNKKVGEEINSQAIVGQSKNFNLDVYSSILVFVGVLSSHLGVPWIEALIGVLIGVFILKTGAGLGRDSILTLMDAIVEPEQISEIRGLAEDVKGVIGVHEVRIRKSGPFCFGEMHMEVEEGLSVEKAHAISEEVERRAKQEFEELETLMIHIEPAKREKLRIALTIEGDRGLESKTNPHFGSAPHFILVDVDQGRVKNWIVKPNPEAKLTKRKGITTANFLIKEGVNTLLTGELGEGPFSVLRYGSVELYVLPRDYEVREAIEAFLNGELEKIISPKERA